MFAREGFLIIGIAFVLAVILGVVGYYMPFGWRLLLFVLAALVAGFTLYFFRDPHRVPPDEAASGNLILAPADGKVVVVQEIEEEPLYIKGPARQVSIFLSPLNVHVNRAPATGVIEYVNYVAGEYLVAWHPKASEKNERSEIGMVHPSGARILFKQIAGAVARRIVFHLKVGDHVTAGQRFGIVKFGSRMDVLVPLHAVIDVHVGDKVAAGRTIIGHFDDADQRLPAKSETGHIPST